MRVLMYGIGSMGSTMARMLLERGATIVGAVAASQEKNGKDVGELVGLDTQLGARVYTDADEALALQPDLVVMSIASYMEDMYEPMQRCIRAGANVISLAEELVVQLEHVSQGDRCAGRPCQGTRRARALYGASGWLLGLAGVGSHGHLFQGRRSARPVHLERGRLRRGGLAQDQQVGTSPESFEEWASTSGRPPTFGRTSLQVLAAMAGLEVVDSMTSSRPDIAEAPVHCKALDSEIPAGKVIGFTDVDVVTTREGIRLRLEMTGKVYVEGETDSNAWEVRGEPTVRILSDHLATSYTTCGTLLNRIPQLLAADPGYLTIDTLPQLRYQLSQVG